MGVHRLKFSGLIQLLWYLCAVGGSHCVGARYQCLSSPPVVLLSDSLPEETQRESSWPLLQARVRKLLKGWTTSGVERLGSQGTKKRREKELLEGKEQDQKLCNDRGRKTRGGGPTLKNKWTRGQRHRRQVWRLLHGRTHYNWEVFASINRAH